MVYMVLSVLILIFLSSQSSTAHLSSALTSSLRGSDYSSSNYGSILDVPITKETFPVPVNNEYYNRMIQVTADRSAVHQRKFLARKDRVFALFDPLVRFQSKLDQYAAIIISDAFAFLHVWKCGGTTIAALAGDTQLRLNETEVQERQWVAFVRDPIDRFLSAWAECGFRQMQHEVEYEGMEHHTVLNWLDAEYDFRVRAFLNEVRDFTFPIPEMTCHTHAHPQTNFMIDENGQLDEHVKMVGDLSELRPVLEIAGFLGFSEEVKGRDASSNQIKTENFPARRDLLKDQTLVELCQFYAMDYYLFDFEPPAVCALPGGPLARYQ